MKRMSTPHATRQARRTRGFIAAVLLASLAHAAEPIRITDSDAAAHIGTYATVEGTVADVFTSKNGNTFLNFGAAFPRHTFSATVFARSAGEFDDLHSLEGKRIAITGRISQYRGKPQIILESAAQLKILK